MGTIILTILNNWTVRGADGSSCIGPTLMSGPLTLVMVAEFHLFMVAPWSIEDLIGLALMSIVSPIILVPALVELFDVLTWDRSMRWSHITSPSTRRRVSSFIKWIEAGTERSSGCRTDLRDLVALIAR